MKIINNLTFFVAAVY